MPQLLFVPAIPFAVLHYVVRRLVEAFDETDPLVPAVARPPLHAFVERSIDGDPRTGPARSEIPNRTVTRPTKIRTDPDQPYMIQRFA